MGGRTVNNPAGSLIGILGTGAYVPKHEVDNDDVAARTGTTPDWIVGKTHIQSRRYAADHEATSDLTVHAAADALAQARLSADAIDYIIVATSTPDSPQPPTACLLQDAIGARRAAGFDINAVCSGFLYGVKLAQSLLSIRPGAHALVVASDLYSRFLDFGDRRSAVLFGDGAGAAVLGPVPSGYGIVDCDLRSFGEANQLIRIVAGGSRLPASAETVAAGDHLVRMNGRGVKEFVLENVPPAVTGLLSRAGVGADEVDHLVPHQPNGPMLDELSERLGLPNARVHRTLERYGNLGSASIPVTLDKANRSGALTDGAMVLLLGFGGGMTAGACLLRWHA